MLIVKPAPGKEKLGLRDPVNKARLPAGGARVPDTKFWRRRLERGDVVEIDESDDIPVLHPLTVGTEAPAATGVLIAIVGDQAVEVDADMLQQLVDVNDELGRRHDELTAERSKQRRRITELEAELEAARDELAEAASEVNFEVNFENVPGASDGEAATTAPDPVALKSDLAEADAATADAKPKKPAKGKSKKRKG